MAGLRGGEVSMNASESLTLAGLGQDEEGVVVCVAGSGRDSVRLMELGLVPGAPVRVLNSGSLRLLALHGGRFGISHDLAASVRVRRVAH